jgi:hypothetical protein
MFSKISSAKKLRIVNYKYVYVGVLQNIFSVTASIRKQHSMKWCWAVCIQMVLKGSNIGHAYVLIGMYYETVYNNNREATCKPLSVLLFYPWPSNNCINNISWNVNANCLNVTYKVWVN